MKLLDDYIFDDRLRYEGHKMIYAPEGNEDIVIQGILGAALLCALLVATDLALYFTYIGKNRREMGLKK